MDWSVLRPRAPHPLLRPELIYTNNIPVSAFTINRFPMLTASLQLYYFAIVGLSWGIDVAAY